MSATAFHATSARRDDSIPYEFDGRWKPLGRSWLLRVGAPFVAFSLMVAMTVLLHRHLYLHPIDKDANWPTAVYLVFQILVAPFLTFRIAQTTRLKIGHQAWEALLPAGFNLAFFGMVFEIYVRVLPIGTSFDAQLRTWAFFAILLAGGWFWIETSFEYFTDQRNSIPSYRSVQRLFCSV